MAEAVDRFSKKIRIIGSWCSPAGAIFDMVRASPKIVPAQRARLRYRLKRREVKSGSADFAFSPSRQGARGAEAG